MLQPSVIFTQGQQRTDGEYLGYFETNNFYLLLHVAEGISQEEGAKILEALKQGAQNVDITDLENFETFIIDEIKKTNIPSHFDLACGFLKDAILYIKTVGSAQIILLREGSLTKIIDGENSASGYIADGDLVIFSPANLYEHLKKQDWQEDIKTIRNPAGMLFISFKKELMGSEIPAAESIFTVLRNKLTLYTQQSGKKKTYTIVAMALLLVIFIWSVGLGYKRRNEQQASSKVAMAKEMITQKLSRAEEVAFLNLPRSLSLIAEARQELERVKKEVGTADKGGIDELAALIQKKESAIVKKEDKPYEEFFDLTVDGKNAKGDRLSLDKNTVAVLDRNRGTIYLLSITKKSLDKKSAPEVKSAQYVASYQPDTVFFTTDGVYKMGDDGKVKKVIAVDKDWGRISDLSVYNGNLYLLDSQKDELYKYLVAEGGYSQKSSYFKSGEAVSLKGANSLAIDSSVYIGFDDHAVKYTAGARDEFKTSYPQSDVQLTKIVTDKDLEKVYGWDKKNGALYVLGKNGAYERQIKSSILSSATDLVVYGNNAYVLGGAKIYRINLE